MGYTLEHLAVYWSSVSAGGTWAGAIAAWLSALVALIGALVGIWNYIKRSRQSYLKATIDYIHLQVREPELIRMFELFRLLKVRLKNKKLESFDLLHVEGLKFKLNNETFVADDVVIKVFNYYEATAIGVRQSALDEDTFKSWWRTSYVWDFIDFAHYVFQKRHRDNASRLYIEYEQLALRWATDEEARLIERARHQSEPHRPD